ncbi:cobalt-precorrin-6A reductase [Paramagnetospirillum kuznetsovii]|uniref:Cobalt-precorrin-6A reductase n=1 Tax=Paramagnetospirillum kuznetsovii TaxID=2053833 RepID=A0A364NU61_9PROT|nr:cobalt-precorrin-6A reductase [Paramagnetospirillum kuznetsovii]RAU20629.1 cobalt-precorrin-6A reductase [Paramagnetospirillum kuznetsovii]
MVRVLILGGTTEAAALARALDGKVEIITSLAGRAGIPHIPGGVRVGGFGGASGLEAYLRAEGIEAVIDATHPFAARISAHAQTACAATGIRRTTLCRAEWTKHADDHWIEVGSMAEAAEKLPSLGKRAFLTVGAGEAAAFAEVAGVWFLVRLLKAASLPLTDYAVITGRPPFSVEDEGALMAGHRIDVLVTKASGGAATYGKIEAARTLGLPVLMIRRPPPPEGESVESIEAAVEWLDLPRPQHMGVVGGVQP